MSGETPGKVASPDAFGTSALCQTSPERGESVSWVPEGPAELPAPEVLSSPRDVQQCDLGRKPHALESPLAHLNIPAKDGICRVPHKPEKNSSVAFWRGTARPKVRANQKVGRVWQTPYATTPKNRLSDISEVLRYRGLRSGQACNNSLAFQKGIAITDTDVIPEGESSLSSAMQPRSRHGISCRHQGCKGCSTRGVKEETEAIRKRCTTSPSTHSEVRGVSLKLDDQVLKMDRELSDKKGEVQSLKKALRRAEMAARLSREAVAKSCGNMKFIGMHVDKVAPAEPSGSVEKTTIPACEDLTKRVCFLEERLTASLQEIDLLKRDQRTFRVRQLSMELQATESALWQLTNCNPSLEYGNAFEVDVMNFVSDDQNDDNKVRNRGPSPKVFPVHQFECHGANKVEKAHKKKKITKPIGEELNEHIQQIDTEAREILQVRAELEKLRSENASMVEELSELRLLPQNLVRQKEDLERARALLIQADRQLDKYKQLFVKGISLEEMLTVVEERDKLQRLLIEKNIQEAALRDEMNTAKEQFVRLTEEVMKVRLEEEKHFASSREAKLCEAIQRVEEKLAHLMEATLHQTVEATKGIDSQYGPHEEVTEDRSHSDYFVSESPKKNLNVEGAPESLSLQGGLKTSGSVTHTLAAAASEDSSLSTQQNDRIRSFPAALFQSTQMLENSEECAAELHELRHSPVLASKALTPRYSRSLSESTGTPIQSFLGTTALLSAAAPLSVGTLSESKYKRMDGGGLLEKETTHSSTSLTTETQVPPVIGEALMQRCNSSPEIGSAESAIPSQAGSLSLLSAGPLSGADAPPSSPSPVPGPPSPSPSNPTIPIAPLPAPSAPPPPLPSLIAFITPTSPSAPTPFRPRPPSTPYALPEGGAVKGEREEKEEREKKEEEEGGEEEEERRKKEEEEGGEEKERKREEKEGEGMETGERASWLPPHEVGGPPPSPHGSLSGTDVKAAGGPSPTAKDTATAAVVFPSAPSSPTAPAGGAGPAGEGSPEGDSLSPGPLLAEQEARFSAWNTAPEERDGDESPQPNHSASGGGERERNQD